MLTELNLHKFNSLIDKCRSDLNITSNNRLSVICQRVHCVRTIVLGLFHLHARLKRRLTRRQWCRATPE